MGKLTVLRYELVKKNVLQVQGSSGGILSKMTGFGMARWSPLGTQWKGSLLAVSTMQGNLLVYQCIRNKETTQDWQLLWEWIDSKGLFIHDLQWSINSTGQLILTVSIHREGSKRFELKEGKFVEEESSQLPPLTSFCLSSKGAIGIDLNRNVWYNNEILFTSQELTYFIKVFNNCIVLCGSTETIVIILNSSDKKSHFTIPYGRLIQPIDCDLISDSKLIVYSSENVAWIISFQTKQILPFIEYNKLIADSLSKLEGEEKNLNTFVSIGACGSIESVKYVIVGKVTLQGFRSCSIISFINKSTINDNLNDSYTINSIYKATLLPEKKQDFISKFIHTPKCLFLFGKLIEDYELVEQSKLELNHSYRKNSIYDICEWSGEELKTPFNLVCSFCQAKYSLNAPLFNCLLCDGALFPSKFCHSQ